MKQITVTIRSIAPILMNRFPMEPVENMAKRTPAEQAEVAAYRAPDGELYIPSEALRQAFIAAAVYSKGRGRASLQKVAAAAMFVSPERIGLGTTEYQIDARPVVIQATRGRVVRHRPRLDDWAASFVIEYDDSLLTETQVRQVVDHAGQLVGILDFRPQTKGPFGRFMVTAWAIG